MNASGNDYAEWIKERIQPNLFFVLNASQPKSNKRIDNQTTKVEKTEDELRKEIISLFHKLECEHYGYKQSHQ